MTCFTPLQGFESQFLTKNGKRQFTQNIDRARRINNKLVSMSAICHKCEGCRFAYSKQMAIRIMHEAQMHNGVSSFITLTYNDDHVPKHGSLDYFGDWESFFKRLRKAISPIRIRFYMIGEYGDLNLRPHYHAIIFGYNFPDAVVWDSHRDNVLYRSPLLESLWTLPYSSESLGYSSIGDVTTASAAYVARYSMKKNMGLFQVEGVEDYVTDEGVILTRPRLSQRYIRYDVHGNRIEVAPERALMSRRPGIGKSWFDKYAEHDLYEKDYMHDSDGRIVRATAYYDKLFSNLDPEWMEFLKYQRQQYQLAHVDNLSPDRLFAQRELFLSKTKSLKRNIRNVYDR